MAISMGFAASPGEARTLRWSAERDAESLDPHHIGDATAETLIHQIYQGLSQLDEDHQPAPQLARGWSVSKNGRVWRFFLHSGVRFHDGRRLRADDVVFSIRRAARAPSSLVRDLRHIAVVTAANDLVVKITTRRPDALLPARLARVMIMSRDWVAAQSLATGRVPEPETETEIERETRPKISLDPISPIAWQAVNQANGTGPYKLVERYPGWKTELVANPDYWDSPNVVDPAFKRLVFLPIADSERRLDALSNGDIDLVLDPPVGALKKRLISRPGLGAIDTVQPHSLMIGFDIAALDHEWDNISGANPFADKRVRQAIAMAVDAEAIRNVILRGRSLPSAMPVPPYVEGWSKKLGTPLAIDLEAAKVLLTEAGYGEGFSVTLHCPGDGYLGSKAICRAIVGMLGQVGIMVSVERQPIDRHMAVLNERLSAFFLLPWQSPTYDSRQALAGLYHTADGSHGDANFSGYSDQSLDAMIDRLNRSFEHDEAVNLMGKAWTQAMEPMVYVPLHHQIDTWVARRAFFIHADGAGLPDFSMADFAQPATGLEEAGVPHTGP